MKTLQRSAILALGLLAQSAQAADATGDKHLAIIKTPEPIEYRMENSMAGGFGWLVHKARNSSMSGRLTTEAIKNDFKPNDYLRNEVEMILSKSGLKITPPPPVGINPVKPYDVKYATIPLDGNALLHVYVERIGIQSRAKSSTYQPYLHVFYCLLIPGKAADGCTYSERSYYGEGYTEEDYLVYPADIADQWADEDDVFRRLKSVETALLKGLSKIAGGVSKDVIKFMAEASPEK